MKYETLGGEIKDTDDLNTPLGNMKIGDRFRFKSNDDVWEVVEKCKWSSAGSSTRLCHNITTRLLEHKLCRTIVTKII